MRGANGSQGRILGRWLCGAGIAVLVADPGWAASVAIPALRDNTLYEDAAGLLSNGAGEYLFAGLTNQPKKRRALLAFDVAAAVPDGAVILSAQLVLEMSQTISGATPVALQRVLADWGEGTSDAPNAEGGGAASTLGDATWIHTFWATTTWASPGGDFSATASATQSVAGDASYTWGSTAAMVADVQAWLDTPAQNFGWVLVGDESTSASAKRFASRENATEASRPRLEIVYGEIVFVDDFESADTSAWSTVVP